jgi:hypothetical protein
MSFRLNEAVEVLESTPGVLKALFQGKSPEWSNCRLEPQSFSPIDVLGHLIYGEIDDWIPRARIILECGQSRPFDAFDRRGFVPLIEGKSAEQLLDWFAELRRQSLDALAGFALNERRLDLTGMHPDVNLGVVTMRNLIATWTVHDLGHIAQIARVMAGRYKEAVGPWRQYLSIVQ